MQGENNVYRKWPAEFMYTMDAPKGHLPLTNALRGTQLIQVGPDLHSQCSRYLYMYISSTDAVLSDNRRATSILPVRSVMCCWS